MFDQADGFLAQGNVLLQGLAEKVHQDGRVVDEHPGGFDVQAVPFQVESGFQDPTRPGAARLQFGQAFKKVLMDGVDILEVLINLAHEYFHGKRGALTGDPLPLRQGFLEFKGQAVILATGLVMELVPEPQQEILRGRQDTTVIPG